MRLGNFQHTPPPEILNSNTFLAQWRQHYFRPDRPLPKDASNRRLRGASKTFSSRLRDIFMSTVCLGLPYLFMRRANSLRITDEESMTRSAGPIIAIGACSCLVVCHTFLRIRNPC